MSPLVFPTRGDCSKPSLGRLLIVRLILFPYTCCAWIYWYTKWFIVYGILRRPYDQEAQVYLTRRRLGLSQTSWDGLGEERQTRFLNKQLWIKRNYQAFLDEEQEKSRLQAAEDSQQKRLRRYVKRHGNIPLAPMDEL